MVKKIIGQNKLKNFIVNKTLGTLPKSLLLIGEKGCGKHFISHLIAEYFNLQLIDITAEVNNERLSEIYLASSPSFYLIDLDKITEKEQNILLKFVEEPSLHTYIILISSKPNLILDTIKGRCFQLSFEPYTEEELREFAPQIDQRFFKYCRTPGQVLIGNTTNMAELADYCNHIAEKFTTASLVNCFNIVDKIAFKEEKDKYNLDLFIDVLLDCLKLKIISGQSDLIAMYAQINKYNNKRFSIPNLNQRTTFEALLMEMKTKL